MRRLSASQRGALALAGGLDDGGVEGGEAGGVAELAEGARA
jgi:hypothetical protein